VDVYLCGHEHHLQYLKPEKKPTHYIISGGGSSISHHLGRLKQYRKFAARKLGFVSLSLTSNVLLLQFISDNEKILYTATIVK
jgi:tartrate-resistant acid phosphatase type 5